MIDQIRNEDGFSLLEIIISVGIMSVLSVFILQMFMSGRNVNLRAHNMDMASHIAAGALEELRAATHPNEFLDSGFIEHTQVAFGLSAFFVIEERQAFSAFDFSNGFTLYKYFDENWQPISLEALEEEQARPDDERVSFILSLYMTPYGLDEEAGPDMDLSGLFNVDIVVRDLRRNGLAQQLVDFHTKVYFSSVGDMYGIWLF